MQMHRCKSRTCSKPGVGKTTLVQTLCRELQAFNPAGFYTAEIRVKGKRQGFELISLDSGRMILAHTNMIGEAKVVSTKWMSPAWKNS